MEEKWNPPPDNLHPQQFNNIINSIRILQLTMAKNIKQKTKKNGKKRSKNSIKNTRRRKLKCRNILRRSINNIVRSQSHGIYYTSSTELCNFYNTHEHAACPLCININTYLQVYRKFLLVYNTMYYKSVPAIQIPHIFTFIFSELALFHHLVLSAFIIDTH